LKNCVIYILHLKQKKTKHKLSWNIQEEILYITSEFSWRKLGDRTFG